MAGYSIHLGYAKRQTKESPLSHWEINDLDLISRVRDDFAKAKTGYRMGVLLVPLENVSGFFSGIVELREGDRLVGEYKARTSRERPRKTVYVEAAGRVKLPARAVDVVLYSKAVLAETKHNESDADWEIISVNARPTLEAQPIAVMTLLHNHFQSDGGTATNMSAEELVAQLGMSMKYWQNKAMLEPINEN